MRIIVELVQARRTEEVDLPAGATGLELLRHLHLAPDAHLVIRGDSPAPLDEPLNDHEQVRILSAISGGV